MEIDRKKRKNIPGNEATFYGITVIGHNKHKVKCWHPGSSKCSPGKHSFGTSPIMYARNTFHSCEPGNSMWRARDFTEACKVLQSCLEDEELGPW